MSLLHPESLKSLTEEGLCRRCDDAHWHEHRQHLCSDSTACACLTCHPAPINEARAIFDALDALLDIRIPKPRRVQRKHRVATLA